MGSMEVEFRAVSAGAGNSDRRYGDRRIFRERFGGSGQTGLGGGDQGGQLGHPAAERIGLFRFCSGLHRRAESAEARIAIGAAGTFDAMGQHGERFPVVFLEGLSNLLYPLVKAVYKLGDEVVHFRVVAEQFGMESG